MKVSELKEIAPLVGVYELKSDAKYLIFIDDGAYSLEDITALAKAAGNCVLFLVPPTTNYPKMFELSDDMVNSPTGGTES